MYTYLIGLFSTIVAWIVIAQVAPKRGRRLAPWMVLAFFIGLLSLIPLFLMPDLSRRTPVAAGCGSGGDRTRAP